MSALVSAVWKYELGPGVTVLDLPSGASALTVGAQGDGVFLWALVSAEPAPTSPRAFLAVGTGHRVHRAAFGRYVGTAFMADGLVFHVFETSVP
jgi:hypothetical protein